jgi:hypothetical protein
MAGSRATRRPLWLIKNQDDARMGVLTFGPGSDEEALPVFSFEQEAETFLRLGVPETGWRARKITAGELISLLHGPCAGVKKVALDPLPVVDGGMSFDLLCWSREDFLRNFAGELLIPNREPQVTQGFVIVCIPCSSASRASSISATSTGEGSCCRRPSKTSCRATSSVGTSLSLGFSKTASGKASTTSSGLGSSLAGM